LIEDREKVSRINWESYYALKRHIEQSQGDHLDRVLSDQMVPEMIRQGDWSLLSKAQSLKT
jgi:hypothetical protein